jgi:hypothetical protein
MKKMTRAMIAIASFALFTSFNVSEETDQSNTSKQGIHELSNSTQVPSAEVTELANQDYQLNND